MTAALQSAASVTPIALPRKQNDFIEPEALRALLKSNLGYNARQVSVSKSHTTKWLIVTIRDAAVDVERVKAFVAQFDTMTSTVDDCYPGQSVRVETTGAVDRAHGEPFMAEVREVVERLRVRGETMECDDPDICEALSNGKVMWLGDRGYWVSRVGQSRGTYCDAFSAQAGTGWAIEKLALDVARV